MRVLNLGGGVQSTTVLLMSIYERLPRLDLTIFADPGWESAATYRHLDWCEEQAARVNLPFVRVSAGNLRADVLQALGTARVGHIGQPPFYVRNHGGDGTDQGGRLWRKCTTEYKIVPIERELRRLLGVAPGQRVPAGVLVEQWLGISVDEYQRVKTSDKPWIVRKHPLVTLRMSRQDCLDWLAAHGFPRPPKSSCIGCPFHSNAHWVEMQRRRPEEFADAVAFEQALHRGKLPGVTGTPYLHRRMRPLAEAVAMDTAPGAGQEAFAFMDECEGACFT
jgi:hypothetical protein